MVLRVYALSGRNKWVLCFMLVYVASHVIFSIALVALPGTKQLSFVGPELPYDAYHRKSAVVPILKTFVILSVYSLRSRRCESRS